MPVTQGRHGFIDIAGVKYPAFNFRFSSPENVMAPFPVSNTWQTHYGKGLKTSRVTASIDLRVKATETLAIAFWNLFMARTFSGGFDDTTAFTLLFSNGKRSYSLANAKAEAFTLSARPGMQVGLQVAFVAPGAPTRADVTPANYGNTFETSAPLMWDNTSYSGVTGALYGWDVSYANNHLIDASLNGTKSANGWDAGVVSVSSSVVVPEWAGASPPFADGASISFSLVGGATRVFTLTSVVPGNPDDNDVTLGQIYKTLALNVFGSAGTAPLVVS